MYKEITLSHLVDLSLEFNTKVVQVWKNWQCLISIIPVL